MEWLPYIHDAIEYIEENLLKVEDPKEIADKLYISESTLQRGFHVLTGYSIAEYIRKRKLYEAALDIIASGEKLIDIAFKYGYETPNSFTKAFTRFHGVNPVSLRKSGEGYRQFLPIKIELIVTGGMENEVKIVKKYPAVFVGFRICLSKENENEQVRALWNDVYKHYYQGLEDDGQQNDFSIGIEANSIGEYGIFSSDHDGFSSYMVAGKMIGKTIPDGAVTVEIPGGSWAIFDYNGPITAGTLWSEKDEKKKWISEVSEYDAIDDFCIEWYESIDEDKNKKNYKSSLWIPVRKKKEIKKNGRDFVSDIKRLSIVFATVILVLVVCFVIMTLKKGGDNIEIGKGPETSIQDFNNEYTNLDIDGVRYSASTGKYSGELDGIIGIFCISGMALNTDSNGEISKSDSPTQNIFVPESSSVRKEASEGYGDDYRKISADVEVYGIKDIDSQFAVAVMLPNDNNYTVYYNPLFKARDYSIFKDSICADKYLLFQEATLYLDKGNLKKIDDCKKIEATFSKMVSNDGISCFMADDLPKEFLHGSVSEEGSVKTKPYFPSTQNIGEDEKAIEFIKGKALGERIAGISISYTLLNEHNIRIYIYSGGWVLCNIGGTERCFYVGEEAVKTFIQELFV